MPVFFFLDPDFATDPKCRDIRTVTLAYTFFRAEDLPGWTPGAPGSLPPTVANDTAVDRDADTSLPSSARPAAAE